MYEIFARSDSLGRPIFVVLKDGCSVSVRAADGGFFAAEFSSKKEAQEFIQAQP